MEVLDNWEMVVYKEDLDANNRIQIEDAERCCALVREIGTDNPTDVAITVETTTVITIDELIAPFYKTEFNKNVMRFSQIRDGRWVTTGFEIPIPLDADIYIEGLQAGKRVYFKGTLFKDVMRGDHPINRYLMARLKEITYKRLLPIYYKDVEIPTTFTKNSMFVLRTDGVATPVFEKFDPTNPHYTIKPDVNSIYILNNPVEVLWQHNEIPPEKVEFRVVYDREDLKIRPRLDHMFFPPGNGESVYVTEEILIPTAAVRSATVGADVSKGSNVKVNVGASVDTNVFAPGMHVMITTSDWATYEIAKVTEIVPTESSTGAGDAGFYLDYIENDYPAGSLVIAPAARLKYQPLAPVGVLANPGGGAVAVHSATGEVFVGAGHDTTPFKFGYYAKKRAGGRDIFTMRSLQSRYRVIEHPHGLAFCFVNKAGVDPTVTGKVTLYTLAIFKQKNIPEDISRSVERALEEARRAGVPI